MKKYCFDTSGISNPLEVMPEDIHGSMWSKFNGFIISSDIAVTTEIYEEMMHIEGLVGDCIKQHKAQMVLDVGNDDWDWSGYVRHAKAMQITHHDYISEYIGGSAKTICLKDLSIIAMAKTLELPVVSMENFVTDVAAKKRRIPNICQAENVEHLRFNDFLRREKVRF